MILQYHKISANVKTPHEISSDTFYAHMVALRAYDVMPLAEYDITNPRHACITFDGVDKDFLTFVLPILKKFAYPFECFIYGDYLGKNLAIKSLSLENNAQKNIQKNNDSEEKFYSYEDLLEIKTAQGRIQWHGKTNTPLSTLSDQELQKEILYPKGMSKQFTEHDFCYFAYPNEEYEARAENFIRDIYKGAVLSVTKSATLNTIEKAKDINASYLLNRTRMNESISLFKNRVSIVVVNYNYADFIQETIDSIEEQTIAPDEILIIDDASTDNSHEVLEYYKTQGYRVVVNEKNMGISATFNKGIRLTSGEYISILATDNRHRCDYVEKSRAALDSNPNAAVAYLNMTIFGPLSERFFAGEEIGVNSSDGSKVYSRTFRALPENPLEQMKEGNFIDGSSMFRRSAYDEVGGFRDQENMPEDHDMFMRMLEHGYGVVQCAEPLLEYRQHGLFQANNVILLQMSVRFWKDFSRKLDQQLKKKSVECEALKGVMMKLTRPKKDEK